MVAAFAERRKVIVDELNAIPGFRCIEPGGAFYAFPNITGTGLPSRAARGQAARTRPASPSCPGTSFGAHGEGYLRFSYANSVENIREAMRRIRACLAAAAGDAGPINRLINQTN